jgi:hypothetical protein
MSCPSEMLRKVLIGAAVKITTLPYLLLSAVLGTPEFAVTCNHAVIICTLQWISVYLVSLFGLQPICSNWFITGNSTYVESSSQMHIRYRRDDSKTILPFHFMTNYIAWKLLLDLKVCIKCDAVLFDVMGWDEIGGIWWDVVLCSVMLCDATRWDRREYMWWNMIWDTL